MFHPALLSAQQVELTIFEGRQDLPEDLAQTQLPSAASIGSSIHQPTRQRGTMPTMPPDIPPATPSGPSGPVRRRSAAPMAPETPPVGFPPGAGEVGNGGKWRDMLLGCGRTDCETSGFLGLQNSTRHHLPARPLGAQLGQELKNCWGMGAST